ncbi:hypothetical protein BU24DRAFT_425149 [Aaosphaeria arxii CBS 175.79]|uniref:Uncharacterized protein n=1 Tax=Aaosphaeria arxii CBS 175.79 TaxID=1450172 RepID=A0A6A5XHR7_9PLEO|nr:uncharacterized protein BU24DRAFT_425149 [Aaosphaeria arxii CBS 175.79]KAF2012503.1 hypothetical protein BU24DRAFT_425149 [Aaosphaeria arxii CBS 175.79]
MSSNYYIRSLMHRIFITEQSRGTLQVLPCSMHVTCVTSRNRSFQRGWAHHAHALTRDYYRKGKAKLW